MQEEPQAREENLVDAYYLPARNPRCQPSFAASNQEISASIQRLLETVLYTPSLWAPSTKAQGPSPIRANLSVNQDFASIGSAKTTGVPAKMDKRAPNAPSVSCVGAGNP